MSLLQNLGLMLLGSAGLTGILAWLAKTLIANWLKHRTEIETAGIRNMYSVELEKLKYEQQKNIEERKTVFNRMHEKRSEIIAELYSKLSDVIDDASYAMAVIENTAMPSKTERFNTMCKTFSDFRQFFNRNRIYFGNDLESKIDILVSSINKIIATFNVFVIRYQDKPLDKESNQAWYESWEKLTTSEIPNLRKNIECEFRKIIGIE